MNKKAVFVPTIDIIAGIIILIAGMLTIFGMGNLGAVFAGVGLLIESIRIILQSGL